MFYLWELCGEGVLFVGAVWRRCFICWSCVEKVFYLWELCEEGVLFVGACVAAEQLPALVHAGESHATHHPAGCSRWLPAGHQTLSAGHEAAHDETR